MSYITCSYMIPYEKQRRVYHKVNRSKSKEHDSFRMGYSQFKTFIQKCLNNLNSLEDKCYCVNWKTFTNITLTLMHFIKKFFQIEVSSLECLKLSDGLIIAKSKLFTSVEQLFRQSIQRQSILIPLFSWNNRSHDISNIFLILSEEQKVKQVRKTITFLF